MIRPLTQFLVSILLIPLLAGCGAQGEGGAPPPLTRPIILDPWGTRIQFRDDEMEYVIFLNNDNTYVFESKPFYSNRVMEVRNGVWKWKVQDQRNAELYLDTEKWMLQFVSPESAMASNPATRRNYVFQFVRSGGSREFE